MLPYQKPSILSDCDLINSLFLNTKGYSCKPLDPFPNCHELSPGGVLLSPVTYLNLCETPLS